MTSRNYRLITPNSQIRAEATDKQKMWLLPPPVPLFEQYIHPVLSKELTLTAPPVTLF